MGGFYVSKGGATVLWGLILRLQWGCGVSKGVESASPNGEERFYESGFCVSNGCAVLLRGLILRCQRGCGVSKEVDSASPKRVRRF